MSDVAAPEWARLTEGYLGRPNVPSSGVEKTPKDKIFLGRGPDSRICRVGENLRQTRLWRMCEELPDQNETGRETSMSQSLIWLYAVAQGLGVLALNVALRVLVS
ncbi:MAG TPA: hypothetical protein VGJ56_19060 [Reyranella sp.]|jgi:hypothetical protein